MILRAVKIDNYTMISVYNSDIKKNFWSLYCSDYQYIDNRFLPWYFNGNSKHHAHVRPCPGICASEAMIDI